MRGTYKLTSVNQTLKKNIYVNECMIHLCMFVFDLFFIFAEGLWSQIDIAQSYNATSLYPVDDVMNNVFFIILQNSQHLVGGRGPKVREHVLASALNIDRICQANPQEYKCAHTKSPHNIHIE